MSEWILTLKDDNDKIKYMDEDGDWVTIQDSADLQLALQVILIFR